MKFLLLFFFLLLNIPVTSSQAQPIIADLSEHIVSIATDFQGAKLVLFGTIDRTLSEEDNIIISIKGPEQTVQVRRKEPYAGIWINRTAVTFRNVPSFYALYSLRSLEEGIPENVARRHQLGLQNIQFRLDTTQSLDLDTATIEKHQHAIIAEKKRNNLYSVQSSREYFSFLNTRLFRVELTFPQNVPVGWYNIDILLIRDGEVEHAQTTPLIISKDGIGAEISLFAWRNSFWYSLTAIALAISLGWGGAAMVRKVL